MAAYGPLALELAGEVGDGFILQLADLDIAAWMIKAVRAGRRAGRPGPGRRSRSASPRRCTSATTCDHMREQCRWFGGMVGNHVADIVAQYGDDAAVPQALTDYIKGRQGYDYNEHGRAGNTHTDFVPDEIVDRFCILGTRRASTSRKLEELKSLGVDQFAGYLQHDNKEETLRGLRRDRHPRAPRARDGASVTHRPRRRRAAWCARATAGPGGPGRGRCAPGCARRSWQCSRCCW